MAAVYPGAQNTFIPNHDATNNLVVDFSRNERSWAVNRYTQVVPVDAVKGYYLKMTVEQAGRIVHSDLSDLVWPDGQPAREGNDETESFEFLPYRIKRYQMPTLFGDLTIDQASWDILAQHNRINAQRMMTAKTQLAITEFTTTGNYDASHVLTVSSISGNTGNWSQSTTARQDIKRSLHTAVELILDDTLGAVEYSDFILVINSALASALSLSQEIVDYIKGSPDALAQVRGELKGQNPNSFYGLPAELYGMELVVEKTRKVTTRKGQTTARTQILPTATPFICARPGGIEGVADSPSFSTVTCFTKEDMTVETKRDSDNRRTIGRLVNHLGYEMTAPSTGVLFQGAA